MSSIINSTSIHGGCHTQYESLVAIKINSRKLPTETIKWLLERITSSRSLNGAQLYAYHDTEEIPNTNGDSLIHLGIDNVRRFISIAEFMGIEKRCVDGNMRPVRCDVNVLGQFADFYTANMSSLVNGGGRHRNHGDRVNEIEIEAINRLFTIAEKQKMILHELGNVKPLPEQTCIPGFEKVPLYEGERIIRKCLEKEIILQIFPLHEKRKLRMLGVDWCTKFLKPQPLDKIREYFGETISIYFAFLSYYTYSLIVPASLSLLYMLFNLDSAGAFLVFTACNLLWATVFLEFWKRRSAGLAFHWGTLNSTVSDPAFQPPRPSFFGTMGTNPITGAIEPRYPESLRRIRFYFVSVPCIIICLSIATALMRFYFYLEFLFADLLKGRSLFGFASLLSLFPTIIYAICIEILNKFYRQFATVLTEFENHRDESSYRNNLILKLVSFYFVNSFMWLFYVAFVLLDLELLRKSLGTLLITQQIIGQFQEVFLPYATMKWRKYQTREELRSRSKSRERILDDTDDSSSRSRVKFDDDDDYASSQAKTSTPISEGTSHQAMVESQLEEYENPLDDYLELFVQFGYVFLFSSVFPPAALCALINNVTEMRTDAFKLCHNCQRPFSQSAKDIGVWQTAFEALSVIAVVTNCSLLAMSSHYSLLLPTIGLDRGGGDLLADAVVGKNSNIEKTILFVLLFVGIEHVFLVLKYLICQMIPDRPEWVIVGCKRIEYQSRRALLEKNNVFCMINTNRCSIR